MHQNCEECVRLWNEYALATRHFLKLEGRLRMADTSRDLNGAAKLRPLLQTAAVDRASLGRQIEEHEGRKRFQVGAGA
jgi:hypothetical protein